MCPYLIFQLPYLGEFVIPSYALFAFVGLFFTMVFLYFRLQKRGMPFYHFLLLMLILVIGVALGSKALFVMTKLPEILQDFTLEKAIYIIWTSGFVFYGGLFGAIIGACLFARIFSIPLKPFLDIIVPGFPLFHFWGRIGCFFAGCCYGKEATWGVAMHMEPDIPRIPVQLFEAACLLLIFGVLLLIDHKANISISPLVCYFLLYSMCRFVLEFFRGDDVRGIWGVLSTSQWISLGILAFILCKVVAKRLRWVTQTRQSC